MVQARQKAKAPSLDVTMAGVHFRSPVGVAAVGNAFGRELYHDPKLHAEANAKVLLDHVRAGAGYVYLQFQHITDETLKKLRERERLEERHYIPPGGFGVKCPIRTIHQQIRFAAGKTVQGQMRMSVDPTFKAIDG